MARNIEDLKDIAAEGGVIATILYHPEFVMHTDWLKTQHFTQRENAAIYWAVNELYKKGITNIDTLNLNNQLNSVESVKKLMTKHNLADISKFMELSQYACRNTVEEYVALCKTVTTLAYKREVFKRCNQIQQNCFSENMTLQEIDNSTHKILNDLTEEFLFSSEIKTVGEEVDDLLQQIRDRQNEDGYGLPSKFKIYDRYFRFEPGELIVVASRMKAGKSALLTNEALDKAINGVPTLIIDSEMDDRMWYTRVLSSLTQIPVRRIKEGHWSIKEENDIKKANKTLKKLPIVHKYMPVVDMDEVFAMCKILKYKMGLQFLCFDYIKANDLDASALSNKMGAITDMLKNEIAGNLGLCVLAACQLNRGMEISSSDKIAMYASTVVMWRFKTSSEIADDGGLQYGNIYTRIDLNRNGEMQDADEWMSLNFHGETMTILDCPQPSKNKNPFEENKE